MTQPPAFVVTTGRSGSLSLALTLNQHPLLCAIHEPYPAMIRLAYQYETTTRPIGAADWFRQHVPTPPGPQQVVLVDQKNSHLIPAIVDAFPEARFIHLLRDGRDVVASGLARGWYTDADYLAPAHGWARYRLQADEVGDLSADEWAAMDPFAKNVWYWSWVNRTIEQGLETTPRWYRLTLEELTGDNGLAILADLLHWLDVSPLRLCLVHTNKSPAAAVATHKWQTWGPTKRATFERLASPEMDLYYPDWRK